MRQANSRKNVGWAVPQQSADEILCAWRKQLRNEGLQSFVRHNFFLWWWNQAGWDTRGKLHLSGRKNAYRNLARKT